MSRFETINVRMRFEGKYLPHPATGCWNWTGAKNADGYAAFWDGESQISGHRFSYIVYRGEIPSDLQIDHLCRNRGCVNPYHLEAVTGKINQHRGRGSWTHCKLGHEILGLSKSGRRFCKECQRRRQSIFDKLRIRKTKSKPVIL